MGTGVVIGEMAKLPVTWNHYIFTGSFFTGSLSSPIKYLGTRLPVSGLSPVADRFMACASIVVSQSDLSRDKSSESVNDCVQDLAARNVVVDEKLVCKISAIDRCEHVDESEPFARVSQAYLCLYVFASFQ